MKEILLTQNQSTFVDDENYVKLSKYKWFAQQSRDSYYAGRKSPRDKSGKQTTILMHRIIMECPSNMQIDHINHNTLDNRKQNLRVCSQSQNNMNQILQKNTSSKYKGVCLIKSEYKETVYTYWQANIVINKKQLYLGIFKSEINAAKAYNRKARELFGEYALLNNIKGI